MNLKKEMKKNNIYIACKFKLKTINQKSKKNKFMDKSQNNFKNKILNVCSKNSLTLQISIF